MYFQEKYYQHMHCPWSGCSVLWFGSAFLHAQNVSYIKLTNSVHLISRASWSFGFDFRGKRRGVLFHKLLSWVQCYSMNNAILGAICWTPLFFLCFFFTLTWTPRDAGAVLWISRMGHAGLQSGFWSMAITCPVIETRTVIPEIDVIAAVIEIETTERWSLTAAITTATVDTVLASDVGPRMDRTRQQWNDWLIGSTPPPKPALWIKRGGGSTLFLTSLISHT